MRYPLKAAIIIVLGAGLPAPSSNAAAAPRCTIVDVAAASETSYALAQDGALYGWGVFDWLGAGGAETPWWISDRVHRPIRVGPAGPVTLVSAGGLHSVALRPDGTVWSWGNGGGGALGDGSRLWNALVPVQASGLPAILSVEAGGLTHSGPIQDFSLALDSSASVWAWGSNTYGQLGDGTNHLSSLPVAVLGLGAAVTVISGGRSHGLATKTDGTVWAWGKNEYAQLGNSTFVGSYVPIQVDGIGTAVSVAAGSEYSLALLSDGTLRAWGDNSEGQLGDGTFSGRTRPVWIPSIDGVVAFSAGGETSYAIRSDGTLWAWGADGRGQVGNGPPYWHEWEPVQVRSLADVVAVSGGTDYALAVTADGTAWAWGYNSYAQLAQESVGASNVPLKVDFDYVPPDQGNVLRAVRSGDDAVLDFDGALAALWQVEATSDKGKTVSVLTSPELEERRFVDSGAVLDGIPRYYQVRGLSLCSSTPGP